MCSGPIRMAAQSPSKTQSRPAAAYVRRAHIPSPLLPRPFSPSIQPLPVPPGRPHPAPPVTLVAASQMPTQLKSDTARANGAKSSGPVTPEGRAASSRNSLRHGFTAASVVLPTESSEDFQSLLDSYIHQFHPQGGVEIDLIQTMAAARWRLRR